LKKGGEILEPINPAPRGGIFRAYKIYSKTITIFHL
jgi:hypothetical protein